MQIRSFIIAYALVLAILLFADRRPGSAQQDRYSHVVDLTEGQNPPTLQTSAAESRTHIIAPGALIPGTWTAGQIPPERLVAPLVVIDLNAKPESQQISLDDLRSHISAPGALIPGTWTAGQIPPERLVAPLVVIDLNAKPESQQISLDDI